MDITTTFKGGRKVMAEFEGFQVLTDQSVANGGEGAAPEPFSLFLASLATCAGAYVQGFCARRNIPVEGIRIVQHAHKDPATRALTSVEMEIQLPADFPPQYSDAVRMAAESCAVKKVLAAPPAFTVTSYRAQTPAAA